MTIPTYPPLTPEQIADDAHDRDPLAAMDPETRAALEYERWCDFEEERTTGAHDEYRFAVTMTNAHRSALRAFDHEFPEVAAFLAERRPGSRAGARPWGVTVDRPASASSFP